jgi:dipeptidyl aminopeptidase/acylaminoacyl peptidase
MHSQPKFLAWFVASLCLAIFVNGGTAQQPPKKPISYDACNGWKSIQGVKISRDGRWLAYTLAPQDGDSELVVRNLQTGIETRHARGKDAVITPDDKHVVFIVSPPKSELDKAKKEKKKPEEQPKGGLGVLNLASGEVFGVQRVKSFKVPEESGRFVAYLLEAPEKKAESKDEPKPVETKPEVKGEPKPESTPPAKFEPVPDEPKKPREKKKDPGTELVVRDLGTGAESRVPEVVEYAWSRDGNWIAYGTSSTAKTPGKDGAFARGADGQTKSLLTGLGHYKAFAFDEKGGQLAFISDRDTYKENPATYKLYYWLVTGETAGELAGAGTAGMPNGFAVSEHGRIEFAKDGSRLYFGCAPPPEPERPEDAPELLKVDIWHFQDPFLQPMQKVRAEDERKRSYRAVVHLPEKRVLALASPDMPEITVNDNPVVGLGASDVPYRRLVSWDSSHTDYYAVSLRDGTRRRLIEKSRFGATLSPGGKYLLSFSSEDSQWHSIRVADGVRTNLTGKLGVRFEDETSDTPEPARAYGSAGWTADDRSVLLYDKYDIWEVRPDGADATLVTGGLGRRTGTIFRYVRLDPEEKVVPAGKPFLVTALDDVTKATGYFRIVPGGAVVPGSARGAATQPPRYAEPRKLIMADKQFGSPAAGGPGGGLLKPKNAGGPFILTAQRFDEFPDLWTAGPDLDNLARVSNANPQQSGYLWGRSELIDYRNADGKSLRALLTKPENFDPSKKYPLLVYIYEELTNGLHRYVPPAPGTSINVARYVSNGYVVLQPDIVYEIGYPGESAFKCVIPAVQKVVEQGYIDPARIGIQGHSWGGYQITYLITRTNIFRAVQAGASVSNMISAYGGIRWGTGMSRAFQYERTQSRIGGPPWAKELEFFENSPIFWVEKVNTPYLSIHNDDDDAVPWYQGIEFFSAMRRLGKEAYMFNYNGEKHGLRERENQKHWTVHQDEFFDHYLLGKPRPSWMENGVPYLDRGKRDVKEFYKD